jgi:DNA-binding CsgD family transcriptional regulator
MRLTYSIDMCSAAIKLTDKILGYNSDELVQILREVASEIGLSHIAHMRFAADKSSDTSLLTAVVTFPKEWQVRYFLKQYCTIDPVLTKGRIATLAFDWDSFDYGDPVVSGFFADAARYRIGPNGVTIPVRNRKNVYSLASFISDASKLEWEAFKRDNLTLLRQLSVLIDSAAIANSRLPAPAVRLSMREEQCLTWAARGKTYQEIATTLGTTEASVKTRLDAARHKLNCANLTHAVGVAFATGVILPTALDDVAAARSA